MLTLGGLEFAKGLLLPGAQILLPDVLCLQSLPLCFQRPSNSGPLTAVRVNAWPRGEGGSSSRQAVSFADSLLPHGVRLLCSPGRGISRWGSLNVLVMDCIIGEFLAEAAVKCAESYCHWRRESEQRAHLRSHALLFFQIWCHLLLVSMEHGHGPLLLLTFLILSRATQALLQVDSSDLQS